MRYGRGLSTALLVQYRCGCKAELLCPRLLASDQLLAQTSRSRKNTMALAILDPTCMVMESIYVFIFPFKSRRWLCVQWWAGCGRLCLWPIVPQRRVITMVAAMLPGAAEKMLLQMLLLSVLETWVPSSFVSCEALPLLLQFGMTSELEQRELWREAGQNYFF